MLVVCLVNPLTDARNAAEAVLGNMRLIDLSAEPVEGVPPVVGGLGVRLKRLGFDEKVVAHNLPSGIHPPLDGRSMAARPSGRRPHRVTKPSTFIIPWH